MEDDVPSYITQLETALTALCRVTGHTWSYSGKPRRVRIESPQPSAQLSRDDVLKGLEVKLAELRHTLKGVEDLWDYHNFHKSDLPMVEAARYDVALCEAAIALLQRTAQDDAAILATMV